MSINTNESYVFNEWTNGKTKSFIRTDSVYWSYPTVTFLSTNVLFIKLFWLCTSDWLIDWLVLNVTLSSISAISWRVMHSWKTAHQNYGTICFITRCRYTVLTYFFSNNFTLYNASLFFLKLTWRTKWDLFQLADFWKAFKDLHCKWV